MTPDKGLSRYDDDDDDDEAHGTNAISRTGPSADLRVAADMEMIGQEYHGKRVSRKKLEASSGAFGKKFFVKFSIANLRRAPEKRHPRGMI